MWVYNTILVNFAYVVWVYTPAFIAVVHVIKCTFAFFKFQSTLAQRTLFQIYFLLSGVHFQGCILAILPWPLCITAGKWVFPSRIVHFSSLFEKWMFVLVTNFLNLFPLYSNNRLLFITFPLWNVSLLYGIKTWCQHLTFCVIFTLHWNNERFCVPLTFGIFVRLCYNTVWFLRSPCYRMLPYPKNNCRILYILF